MYKRNWISLLGSCVTAVSVAVCSGEAAPADGAVTVRGAAELALTSDESQCGPTWDLQDVEQYDGTLGVSLTWVQRHEGAVAYQVSPGCSGTMISDDLFISAGHCGYGVGDVIRFNYQDDPNGNPQVPQDFTVAAIVEQEDNANWDYAIVRLNGNPGRIFGYARLADRDEDIGDNVVIIGHPAGVPKALHAGAVLDYASSLGANWFRHQVDTTGGSSGAGVLSEDGYLVGVHTNAGCNPGNSAMRITRLLDHSATLQSALVWQRGAHGWVWANNATSAAYTPSISYQFNSSGATNTITRSGIGAYTVRFPGIGATGVIGNGRGGNVQVTAYSPGVYCKVSSWSALGADVNANIRCFDFNGVAQEARYVAIFNRSTFEGFADEHGQEAYVWSQSTSYVSPTNASATYSWNDANGTNTISQSAIGTYSVVLPGVDAFDASVLVTAYGSGNARCQVSSWSALSSSVRVNVYCTTPAGAAANSQFTLSFSGAGVPGRLAAADNAGAYAWANKPSVASYTPSLSYQGNDMGRNLTINRNATGDYTVNIPHPGVVISRDAVLVTAYGATGQQCLVDHWSRAANNTQAYIRCYDGAGVAVDTRFTLSYLTSNVHNP